jgi:oligopeptide transport system substrate-binding protein
MVVKKITNKVAKNVVELANSKYYQLKQSKYIYGYYGRFLIFLMLVLFGVILVKFSPPSSIKNELNIVILNSNLVLDIHKSSNVYNDLILKDLYEGLVELDSSNNIIPAVASKWIINYDYTIYRFYLKKSYWSNGEPIIADDFVFAFKKILDDHSLSSNAYLLFNIYGAIDYFNGDKDKLAIKAIDDYTLEIKLINPDDKFLNKLDSPAFYPLPSKISNNQSSQWLSGNSVITNGAYKILDFQPNNYLRLTKNTYYQEVKDTYKDVKYIFLNDIQKAIKMYNDKQIAMILNIPANFYQQAYDDYGKNILFTNNKFINFLFINKDNTKSTLLDKDIRRYLFFAINNSIRNFYNSDNFKGVIPVDVFIQSQNYDVFSEFNIEELKNLILSKGYSSNNPIKMNILYNKNSLLNELVLNSLSKELLQFNIQINLQVEQNSSYVNKILQGDFELALRDVNYNQFEEFDIFNKINFYMSNNINNDKDNGFSKNITSAKLAKDGKIKNNYYFKAQNILLNDSYYIPLFINQNFVLFNNKIDRYKISNMYFYRSKNLKFNQN